MHTYLLILVDVKDAMGANMINSILESVANKLREWFPEEEILFSILSNFATESLASACCEIPFERLGETKKSVNKLPKSNRQGNMRSLTLPCSNAQQRDHEWYRSCSGSYRK